MRNTSDPIKENSNVMNTQGGEKKVMKKILSVALSTAMAFSMFASVAFGDTAVSPQQQFDALKAKGIFEGFPNGTAGLDQEMTRGQFAKVITKLLGLKEVTGQLSYKDKNYTAKNWAVPYIEAVTAAGIMQGKDTTKKIFDFNGKVTIAEMATILTRALDLEVPAETNNNAPEWAKKDVQAAINAGLVDANANFTANASRQLLVGAAYAVDQAQSLKVSSYEVSEAGKVVTFKISDGESVKVTLDKALEANKETEVKFTYKEKQFTEKVTYKTTAAQAVASATATNLKEITVKFDGTVDQISAESKNNYVVSGVSFKSATLSDDKTTVTLLVDQSSSALTNQRVTSLQVNNVKNSDATKTITQKVEFTPLDVAVPEVKEVKALGTKAFKVVFSEPVKPESVISSSFRVDNNVIAASVKYVYPNTAIVTTDLSAGEHTLRVSGVQDYSGLSIVPVETKFTAAVDTEAPKVVSVKSNDLKEVTVEFDETVKSVASAYANTTGNTAQSIEINDNKVTLKFNNPLNVSENTVYLTAVSDYSNNSASVDAKVTPTLDTVRPTVVGTEFKMENGNYFAEIQFSKSLQNDPNRSDRATNPENYVLKDADGKVVTVTGLNSKGNPVIAPTYNSTDKKVRVNLGSSLKDDATYTLTVSGIADTAYIGNVLLPYTATLNANTAQNGKVTRVWSSFTDNTRYVYVQFNKTLATSGEGNALEAAKYTVSSVLNGAATPSYQIAKENNDINLISTNTVRIATTGSGIPTGFDWSKAVVTASYIKDSEGKYFNNGSYNVGDKVTDSKVAVTGDVYATSHNEIKVKFDAALSSVNLGDFQVNGVKSQPTSYTLADNNKTLLLKFADNAVPVNAANVTLEIINTQTQDAFGNKITATGATPIVVKDGIAPTVSLNDITKDAAGTAITIIVDGSESLAADLVNYNQNYINGLFTVDAGTGVKITNVQALVGANTITITATADTNVSGKVVNVKFDGAKNKAAEAITDGRGNALGEFTFGKQLASN
ncbi:S-layer homology domain-containing protein [Paenibacillus polysaccharolyticus]|uniref:S-layer homology domain-containing protein n=1 Tax=Paenibacillus polysaccharolyticus TaxID=582692 RepID=A0A1G5K786_9BACL|nr:S-layer homology domain-containing protein [Paenibacillus polysaccharolyticus]SCY95868.1 S-layer homology domain-containing protein [Paenibacillus polysaccharolyticus]